MSSLDRTWIVRCAALLMCGASAFAAQGADRRAPERRGVQRASAAVAQPAPQPEAPRSRVAVDAEAMHAVRAALAPAESSVELDTAAIVETIVAVGPHALDASLALLCGEAPPPGVAAGTLDKPIHPTAVERREEMLRAVIARFAPELQLAAIEARGVDATLDVRLALIRLLGSTPHPGALGAIGRMLEPIEEIHFHRDYVTQHIEAALASRATEYPARVADLSPREIDGSHACTATLVRGLSRARGAQPLDWIDERIGVHAELDTLIVRTVARIEGQAWSTPSDDVLRLARQLLSSMSEDARCAAVELLGVHGDLDDADQLLARTFDADPLVASVARKSLRKLVGIDLGSQPETWTAWIEAEREWQGEHLEPLLAEATHEDASTAVAAIRSALSHRTARRICADAFVRALEADPDDAIACALIEALATCGGRTALPVLALQLDSSSTPRREGALRALQTLTGFQHGADREEWRAVSAGSL